MNGTDGFLENVLQSVVQVQEPIPEQNSLKKQTEELVLASLPKLKNAKLRNAPVTNLSYVFLKMQECSVCCYSFLLTIIILLHLKHAYAVHCEWNDWVIGECSKDCGGGTRTNTRTEKLSADHGGDACDGASSIEESCNIQECPGKII